MNQITNYFGIDISKDVFDVNDHEGRHYQFSNDLKGFKAFMNQIDESSHCVMEATGCYHFSLANYLYAKEIKVSVVNALVIKRFIQMRLRNTKTDKADAVMIRLYAEKEHPELWHPREKYMEACVETDSVVRLLIRQRTALKNKIHSLTSKGSANKAVLKVLNKQIKEINTSIEKLELEMEQSIKEHEPEMLAQLTSIPGMGRKTAIFLIILTNAYENFDNHRQLSAFIGLAPTERVSGSSIKGQSRISKAGNATIRNLLFMCSFSACLHNKACRDLYERIIAKGKSKKLALIAVANKLIKQSFAMAKNGLMYDENHRSRRPVLS